MLIAISLIDEIKKRKKNNVLIMKEDIIEKRS